MGAIPASFFPKDGGMENFQKGKIKIPDAYWPAAPLTSVQSLLGYMDQPLSPLHRETSTLGWFLVIDWIKAAIVCRGENFGQLILDVDIDPLGWHELVGYTKEDEPEVACGR